MLNFFLEACYKIPKKIILLKFDILCYILKNDLSNIIKLLGYYYQ